MNQRALRKAYEIGSKSWANLSDNNAIDIEDSVLELLDQKEALEDQMEGDQLIDSYNRSDRSFRHTIEACKAPQPMRALSYTKNG